MAARTLSYMWKITYVPARSSLTITDIFYERQFSISPARRGVSSLSLVYSLDCVDVEAVTRKIPLTVLNQRRSVLHASEALAGDDKKRQTRRYDFFDRYQPKGVPIYNLWGGKANVFVSYIWFTSSIQEPVNISSLFSYQERNELDSVFVRVSYCAYK